MGVTCPRVVRWLEAENHKMNNSELDALDDDLREYYTKNFMTEYVAGVPIKIQIVRLLRKLLHQRDNGENRSSNGEDAQNNVQNQNLNG